MSKHFKGRNICAAIWWMRCTLRLWTYWAMDLVHPAAFLKFLEKVHWFYKRRERLVNISKYRFLFCSRLFGFIKIMFTICFVLFSDSLFYLEMKKNILKNSDEKKGTQWNVPFNKTDINITHLSRNIELFSSMNYHKTV